MPRKRMVSPELLTSESVAALPVPARYAFVGLWMYLDDEGRGKDNPALLRAHLWPLDEAVTTRKVSADIERWAQQRLICRYRVDGQSYLHVPSWKNWQSINRPTPTRFPACPVDLNGDDHDSLPPSCRDAHGVITDSYVSHHDSLPRNRKEVNRSEENLSGSAGEQSPSGSPAIAEIRAMLGKERAS